MSTVLYTVETVSSTQRMQREVYFDPLIMTAHTRLTTILQAVAFIAIIAGGFLPQILLRGFLLQPSPRLNTTRYGDDLQ